MRESRGKLMREIIRIAAARRPSYIFLENVGNFERIASGSPWNELRTSLESLGYHVRATEHVVSGGRGLISPHHLGHPHQRERFYVVATLDEIMSDPFPARRRNQATTLNSIVEEEPLRSDLEEAQLTNKQVRCINFWNRVVKAVPEGTPIVSPLWGDEAWEQYPYDDLTPWATPGQQVRELVGTRRFPSNMSKQAYMKSLPSYAQSKVRRFPKWKVGFIADSRAWFASNKRHLEDQWKTELKGFPPSLRKLEWNCGNEVRDLWTKVLQFRPSGLRAKRYNASPALVAMTSTQIPILGPERRYLTRKEGLRLQGFPDDHNLPASRIRSFAALGNAVHVHVVAEIVKGVFHPPKSSASDYTAHGRSKVEAKAIGA